MDYLKERIGNDLHRLEGEIEKLILFFHSRPIIEKGDVQELVGEGRDLDVFDLARAFREREIARVLFDLSQLLDRGERATRILALIAREIGILLRLKRKGGKITSDEACSIIFPGRGYYVRFYQAIARSYVQGSRAFTEDELISGHHQLVEAEFSIKTGREEERRALEKLILSFLH